MNEHSAIKPQASWVRVVLAIYIALSIVMCFNKLLVQKDYEVFVNEDGLPELEE